MSDAKRLAALKAVWKELESFHTECDSVLFPDGVPDDDDIDKLFQKTLQGTLTKSDAQKLCIFPPVDIRRLDDPLDASELLKAVDDLEQCYPGGELPEEVRGSADKLRALFRHPIQRRQVWQALRLTRPKWFPWIADEANRPQGIDLQRDRDKMGVVPELMLEGELPFTVDALFLGRKHLPIWNTDYAVIDGEQPIVCPFAEPKLHQGVLERLAHNLRTGGIGFKAVNEAQQTICWLGHQSKTVTLCECYLLKRPYRECPLKRKEKLGDEGPTWDDIERELSGLLTLMQRSLFNPLWEHRNVVVKWDELKKSYSGSKGERAIQVALKGMLKRLALSKKATVGCVVPSTISRHTTVMMTVDPRTQIRAEK